MLSLVPGDLFSDTGLGAPDAFEGFVDPLREENAFSRLKE